MEEWNAEEIEEILNDGNEEELDDLKVWLFKENIRIESEKKKLQELYVKFLAEKEQFQEEMKTLNHKVLMERKRLKEDELFFNKKMDILKNGFGQLEQDRKKLQKDRMRLEADRDASERVQESMSTVSAVKLFFKGVSNPLTLKKRYKDLIKIFHPDNLCGDTDTIQMINKEYELLQEEFEWQKKA